MEAQNNVIYMHRNQISGKSYVGLTTKTITVRWAEHCYNAYKQDTVGNYIQNTKFYRAIRKYGLDTWEHLVLYEGGSNMSLPELEIYYIEKYDTFNKGYNMTLGGFGNTGASTEQCRMNQINKRSDTVKGYYYNKKQNSYQVLIGYLGEILHFGNFKLEADAKDRTNYIRSLSDKELVKSYEEYKANKSPKYHKSHKSSKAKGYYLNKKSGKYNVQFKVDGELKYFGSYTSEQEAKNKVAEVRDGLSKSFQQM